MEGRERGGKSRTTTFWRGGMETVCWRAAVQMRYVRARECQTNVRYYPTKVIDGRRSDGTEPTRAAVSLSRRVYTMVCDRLHSGHVARSPAASLASVHDSQHFEW